MWSLITELKDTPLPTILVIAGIGFVLLGLAGDIKSQVHVHGVQRWVAGGMGFAFIGLGIAMYLSPQVDQLTVADIPPPSATPLVPTTAPSATITPTPTATSAPTPTDLPTPTASSTATPTLEATTPAPAPTATPVVTPTRPLPTPTATPVATSTPIAPPIVYGNDPRSWMLTLEDFSATLVQQTEHEVTNEVAAQDSQGNVQPQVLEDFRRWGRITGYQRTYGYQNEAQASRVYRVFVQSVVYESATGAEQGFVWGRTMSDSEADMSLRSQPIDGVGEQAYLLARNDRFGRDVRLVEVVFRRHNVLGMVSLAIIPDSLQEPYVRVLTAQLAKLMDLNIEVAAAASSNQPSLQQFQPDQDLREYFALVNQHDYQRSWSWLTPYFRQQHAAQGYVTYADYWSRAGYVEVVSVKLNRRSGNKALVTVHLNYRERSKEAVCRYVLLFDEARGVWLFDDSRELSVTFPS